MTEIAPSADRKVQLQLHLQASEDLKELVGKNLIAPELRREFARRIFYLQLVTPQPVELKLGEDSFKGGAEDESAVLRAYKRTIEDDSSKLHMYVRHLQFAPEIGYKTLDGVGVSLRFRLALTALEASQLLAPPFDGVEQERAFLRAHWRDSVLVPEDQRIPAVERMRTEFGVYDRSLRRAGQARKLTDHYYVNRPAVKTREIDSDA